MPHKPEDPAGTLGLLSTKASRQTASGGLQPLTAALLMVGAAGLAGLVARQSSPDKAHPRIQAWYRRLDKPDFTPPDAVFGLAWPALETLMAAAGYRLLRAPSSRERNVALALLGVNFAMIPAWTKVFFGEREVGGGLGLALAYLGTSVGFVAAARPVDPLAAAAGVPLAAWVAFASAITEEVWRTNEV